MVSSRVVQPVSFDSGLQDQYVKMWRDQGFVVLDGLLSPGLFQGALDEVDEVFERNLNPDQVEELARSADFGSGGMMEFPCPMANVNLLTLAKPIIKMAKACLGTDDIRLIQGDAWCKYGASRTFSKEHNRDQRMHMDYGNNTMLHPPKWSDPEVVSCIVSFDDTDETGGGTGVVARQGDDDELYQWPYMAMPGMGKHPWVNSKDAELEYFKENDPEIYQLRLKLYEREQVAHYRPGSVLFYRHDLWHRGTPLLPGKVRRVLNLGFRKASSEWVTTWNQGWVRAMYDKEKFVEQLFPKLDVEQLSCLGFPPPKHPFWTTENFAAVKARWEAWGMDMTPYAPH